VREGQGVGEIGTAAPADRAYVAGLIDAVTDLDAAFSKAVPKLAALGFASWQDLASVGLDLSVDSLAYGVAAFKKKTGADQAGKGATP